MQRLFSVLFLILVWISPCLLAKDMAIKAGGFYSQSDTSINVTDPIVGDDFRLDYEGDLKLAEQQFLPFIEFEYRFDDRHHLFMDWKRLHRSGETSGISRPFQLQINDTIYEVREGAKLNTILNLDILRIGYGYDLIEGANYSLGLSTGIHTMLVKSEFSGEMGACLTGELNNNLCGQHPIPQIMRDSVTSPLPNLGIMGRYELFPGWELTAHGQYFYLKLDEMQGSLKDIRVSLSAEFAPSWSLALAYNYYQMDVNLTPTSEHIKVAGYNIRFSFLGPVISVSYRF